MERFSYRPAEKTAVITTKRGSIVSITSREKPTKTPGEVAWHESAHVTVAGRIKSATIVQSGTALGSTTPEIMTAPAAAAAEADGGSGTGHDRVVTEIFLGVGWEAAQAAARPILAAKRDVQREIAGMLEEEGTIGQRHVEEAETRVRRRRAGIHLVRIQVTDSQGRQGTIDTETNGGEVVVPIDLVAGEEILLPKAA